MVITKKIGNKVVGETKTEEKSLETAVIKNGKKIFAEKIVPTLPENEFEHFRLVFEKVDEIAELFQSLGQ